ncbi:hypothetical protein GCM10020295_18220 [Streptomyces cinereospinus]
MRRINGTALIIAALAATVGALAFPVWSYADRSGTGQANLAAGAVSTRWGPLTAQDRDLIVRVRLAACGNSRRASRRWSAPPARRSRRPPTI